MVSEMTADELAERLDREEAFALVDTRPPESYRSWHVPGARNVPYGSGDAVDEDAVADLLNGERVVTICAKGKSSSSFAEELESLGSGEVTVVEGGMEAWSQVYEMAQVETGDDAVEVVQVQRRAKGCLGYVVGSSATGEAAAVDVTRHADEFRRAADEAGYEIVRVLDTHIHADHLSGGRALASDLDVPYHLGAAAEGRDLQFDYEPIAANDVVTVGDVEVKALATPGHTTESVSYLVDAAVVLTADALHVDGVGRTELQFGGEDGTDHVVEGTIRVRSAEGAGRERAAEGARMLYRSLHDSLLALPDSVRVLPGHVTVTDDGEWQPGRPGEPVAATVGDLRRSLDVLALDEEAFVERITGDLPEEPPNYEEVLAINTGRESPGSEERATSLELGPNNCAAG